MSEFRGNPAPAKRGVDAFDIVVRGRKNGLCAVNFNLVSGTAPRWRCRLRAEGIDQVSYPSCIYQLLSSIFMKA